MRKAVILAIAVLLFLVTCVAAVAAVHVKGYYRKDGTYVQPHYRSNPDHNFYNNYSTKGNINPYTGKEGTRVTPPPGYGSSTYSTPTYVAPSYQPAVATPPVQPVETVTPQPVVATPTVTETATTNTVSTSNAEEALNEYLAGDEAFNKNDLTSAISHWERVLQLKPDSEYTKIMLGKAKDRLAAQSLSVAGKSGGASSQSVVTSAKVTSASTHVTAPLPTKVAPKKPAPKPKPIIVHITKTGAKYHRGGCRYLARSDIPIDKKEAIRQGYTPCKICKP